ncbi:MAG: ABC transporter permease [Breznakibacter sp.]|nr:ABC transporter permease [Breznakibacter sp.]
MNSQFFIAKRIISNSKTKGRLAGPIIKVATLGIILGVAVMILSIAIGSGFQKEIKEKIIGFTAPVQVINYDFNQSYESSPVTIDSGLVEQLKDIPKVTHIQQYATKPGIIKTSENVQGVILKGVGADYNWKFIKNILIEGDTLALKSDSTSNGTLISKTLAEMLQLKLGDGITMYFIQENIRARKFIIKGIFDSHLPEYDKIFLFVDIKHIQKLNGWKPDQATGLELQITNLDELDSIASSADLITNEHVTNDGSMLRVKPIYETEPQLFGWLDILDTNVVVIILLVLAVAGFNMISGLLILILERTNMIGILKALGMANESIRTLFIYLATYIIGRGVFWGNIIGISLCLLQKQFSLFKLDPSNYYLDTVPINLEFWPLLLLNLGTLVLTVAMMFLPTFLITKITPTKAIKFE